MAKAKTVFVCNNCGYESAKWLGRCPACNEWNTFYEEKLTTTSSNGKNKERKSVNPVKLGSVVNKQTTRISTGIEELNRVLGGGIVEGSLILLGGEPGIRKININFANM